MIISRTPLRVSLFGGGTDLPEFYEEFGGAILSFAINKYVYVTSNESFDKEFRVAYSEVELERNPLNIRNPIVRESLIARCIEKHLEITTVADVPSRGTGLASSSAFAVGLLNVLSVVSNEQTDQLTLAEEAFQLERIRVGDAVGKQDHYGTSVGGFKFLQIDLSGRVKVSKLDVTEDISRGFLANLLIVYTGVTRSAKPLLVEQQRVLESKQTLQGYLNALSLAKEANDLISKGFYDEVGKMLTLGWNFKKSTYSGISNVMVDEMISQGLKCGATGAKLLGAGGGGFVLFYAPSELHSKIVSNLRGVRKLPFRVDEDGSLILYRDPNE